MCSMQDIASKSLLYLFLFFFVVNSLLLKTLLRTRIYVQLNIHIFQISIKYGNTLTDTLN